MHCTVTVCNLVSLSFLVSQIPSFDGPLIQVDIGGHPPIPLGAPPFSLSVFQFRLNLLFLAVFRVLNFRSRMPKLRPWEVETPIYPNGAHSFGASSPRVRVLAV